MTKKRSLNRTKPFSTISGAFQVNGKQATYEQNGLYFNQNGEEIGGDYVEVDDGDRLENLAQENERLRAMLAEKEEKKDGLDREEVIEQLEANNIPFDKRQKTKTLYKLLQEHLDGVEGD